MVFIFGIRGSLYQLRFRREESVIDKLNFEHEFDDDSGLFYLVDEGDRIGKITYQQTDANRYIVDWVEVEPEFREQGLARRLIDRMANFARDRGMMIVPTCGVTRSIMERHSEYHDVLAEGGESRPEA